ncbi:hypothetical protein ACFPM0_13200 [Pseudonocardia sulfidoxydans]|uniref:hypothetical protein n=1 Tax=Pseudonocardia sulfidoxydans TaxID=54011 RepID=UPI00360E1694
MAGRTRRTRARKRTTAEVDTDVTRATSGDRARLDALRTRAAFSACARSRPVCAALDHRPGGRLRHGCGRRDRRRPRRAHAQTVNAYDNSRSSPCRGR